MFKKTQEIATKVQELKTVRNKWVLSLDLNTASVVDWRISLGVAFQPTNIMQRNAPVRPIHQLICPKKLQRLRIYIL